MKGVRGAKGDGGRIRGRFLSVEKAESKRFEVVRWTLTLKPY